MDDETLGLTLIKELYPIITVLISGLFGLLVAITTWKLANKKEISELVEEIKLELDRIKNELYKY